MKALEILKELHNEDIWLLQKIRLEHTQISSAIEELEQFELKSFELEKKQVILFCHECGYSGECAMEREWNTLSFEYGECDDGHFTNPYGCNKAKPKNA